jgi:hypothetical protein
MGTKAIAFLHWELLRLQRRWGWPLWVGFAMVALASWCGYQAWMLGEAAEQAVAFERVVPERERPRPRKPVSESDLLSYYEALPTEDERFALVKRLLLAAQAEDLLPQQVDYKLEAEAMTKVVRYQLVLPLKGDFSRIQAFLVEVLNENRSVAIDSLSIERESVERGDLEARVQFSIFMVRA